MAGFVFRLQPLLNLRAAERDRRREQLADAYRAAEILQQQMEQLAQETKNTRQQTSKASQPGEVVVDYLLNSHRYELLLRAQTQQLREQQQHVDVEIERRRQALLEADRELRALEKLRERQQDEFRRMEHRRQMRELDELVLQRRQSSREVDRR